MKNELLKKEYKDTFLSIKNLMIKARTEILKTVNMSLILSYWEIGRIIVEDEQNHLDRAEYGTKLLKQLSKDLTKEFGKGFSRTNLQNIRNLFLIYPKCQTLSGKLEK